MVELIKLPGKEKSNNNKPASLEEALVRVLEAIVQSEEKNEKR